MLVSEFTRNCPKCQCQIKYINEVSFSSAVKKNSGCRKCAGLIISDKINERNANGIPNPFKGKKHTDEFKQKARDRQLAIADIYRTEEHRKKLSDLSKGEKNPMFGRTVFQVWVEKYGEEEAVRLNNLRKEKASLASKGSKNPMFGKPSPGGSGVGWKGYYKSIFFRSLRELMYMVELDDMNIIFQSGEFLKIEYTIEGVKRTYRPDFILPELRKVVEIKPTRLINSKTNLLKFEALTKWCHDNNYTCEIRDIVLDHTKILTLYENGTVKFYGKYDSLFNEYRANQV